MRHTESGALTGQQLLDLLLGMDPDELANPIHFSYNYGDHWRTQVAPEVSEVQVGSIAYSAYHQMFQVLDEDKVDEAERALRGAIEDPDQELDMDTPVEYDGQPILKALIIG